jgi:hypothetical protein
MQTCLHSEFIILLAGLTADGLTVQQTAGFNQSQGYGVSRNVPVRGTYGNNLGVFFRWGTIFEIIFKKMKTRN